MKLSTPAKLVIWIVSVLLGALLLIPVWNYIAVPAGVALPIGYTGALGITLFTSVLSGVLKAIFNTVAGR